MRAFDMVVYHVFPLGACGAPAANDATSTPVPRIRQVTERLDQIAALGANTLLLGPVWECEAHGYDTVDLSSVDRRLGTAADLVELAAAVHRRGMRLILDAVFNHVGRGFWAFQDVLGHGPDSAYCDWFHLDFAGRSPVGDAFSYEGWAGNYELVKLNVDNPAVREYLFAALDRWMADLGLDGLRVDAADDLSRDFLAELAEHCRELWPEAWLVGEMVKGDYREIAGPGMLDGATNYELYKSLWSAFVDVNQYEVAFALDRQFGAEGIYRGLPLLNFADNHDVDRVAGSLTEARHLYPLYGLLFTVPGIPSIYYGSEVGEAARRTHDDDSMLRPRFDAIVATQPDLALAIERFATVRAGLPALRRGDYRQIHVSSEQLAFARGLHGRSVLVAVNAAAHEAVLPVAERGEYWDHLNAEAVHVDGAVPVPSGWLRVLTRR